MGIFDTILGSNKNKKENTPSYLNWISLTSLDQLETIKQTSKTAPVFIFKHSTRCGVSSMVIKQFEKLFKEEHQHLIVYYLDLLNYRNISDEVGYTFQVTHQSPQLIVVKNEVVVHHASHYDVTQTNLSRFI